MHCHPIDCNSSRPNPNYIPPSSTHKDGRIEFIRLVNEFIKIREKSGNMIIDIKKLNDKAIIPTQANKDDAGFDLYACTDTPVTIKSGETVKIPTGLAIAIPSGYFGAIFARSGLATKKGLRPANCVGVCDAPYRGEYIVALHNDSYEDRTINPGDRIAQLIIMPCLSAEFNEVDELSETDRGEGGFGSTGK